MAKQKRRGLAAAPEGRNRPGRNHLKFPAYTRGTSAHRSCTTRCPAALADSPVLDTVDADPLLRPCQLSHAVLAVDFSVDTATLVLSKGVQAIALLQAGEGEMISTAFS